MSVERIALAQMHPVGLVDLACEAVRGLNRATVTPTAYRDPGDVAQVVAGLFLLAQRLPQALVQARSWLERLDAAGELATDGRHEDDEPRVVVGFALGDLERAEREARDLRDTLECAARWTSFLCLADAASGEWSPGSGGDR